VNAAKQYVDTTTSPAKEDGGNFINDAATAILNAHVEQGRKAADDFQAGRYSEAVGHTLAAAVPLVGPAAAAVGERIGKS